MQKYISQIYIFCCTIHNVEFFRVNRNPHYDRKRKVYTPSPNMSWEEFGECLKNPFYRPEISWEYKNLPETIAIGKIAPIGEKLLKESINDPHHRERGTYVKVDIYDKLLARKAEFADIGNEFSVDINHVLEGYSQFRYGDTTEKLAAVIHTHPRQYEEQVLLDVPSFLDISGLLSINPSAPSVSVIYVEKSKNSNVASHILLVRTKDTIRMEYDEVDVWIETLNMKFYANLHSREENAIEIARRLIIRSAQEVGIGIYFSKNTQEFRKNKDL